ncbi:MAG: amidohydrolase family protein [Chitinophagaceae bacterium]|nr:amidohydrolase family protein [Chitinophagaceae bacterium]
MGLRKLTADQIFTGEKFIENQVLVITEDGFIETLIPVSDAGDGIERMEGMLTPGFINCHCHLELSHMKGLIPEKTGLTDFVLNVVTQRYFDEELILNAIETAENEMLGNGIVAVGDICNNTLTLQQKIKNRLAYYNFIEASGWLPGIAEMRFERSKQIYGTFIQHSTFNIQHNSIIPHAPYSVSAELWKLLQPGFAGKVISIHNQETAAEDELFFKGTGAFRDLYKKMNIDDSFFTPPGCSSVQCYYPNLSTAKNVLLVHNSFTTQSDIEFIRERNKKAQSPGVFFCLCIKANLYIENAIPPIELLLKNGCDIVLGTDSLASNDSLDILSEMKVIQSNFPQIGAATLLKWATLNGAVALDMSDKLGSFVKGKKPGINLVSNMQNDKLAKAAVKKVI